MHTLTDEELKREPQTLLDETLRGEVTIITVDGRAVLMAVPLDDGVPSAAALLDLASLRVEGYAQHRGKGGELRISTVDFSGYLQVGDAEALRQALFAGVGHAKAFGCGLLLVRPAA